MIARSRITPIGIDVDGHTIAAVQLAGQRGRWQLESAAVFSRPENDGNLTAEEVSRLAGLLERRGFRGTSISLGISDGSLLTGMLELPPVKSGAPLEQIAKVELARMHKRDATTFECGVWPLPAPARSTETTLAMAAACSIEEANQTLDLFEHEGLQVDVLDVMCLARARACESLISTHTDVTALLDFRWDSAAMSIVHQNTVVYERTLVDHGLSAAHKELNSQLHVKDEVSKFLLAGSSLEGPTAAHVAATHAFVESRRHLAAHIESIVHELQTSCAYVTSRFAGATKGSLLLFGAGAAIPGIDQMFAAAAEMEVRLASPALCFSTSAVLFEVGSNARLTTAAGLALFEE